MTKAARVAILAGVLVSGVLGLGPAPALAGESHSLIVYTALFDKQSSTLAADDAAVLGMMADLMKDDPTYSMKVVAYTDPVDEDDKDEALSKTRANAVRDFLVGKGVGKDAVSVKGRGDEAAFGRDDSETDRALRRRAEIRIRQEDRAKRTIDAGLDKDVATKVQTTVFFDFDKSDVRPEYKGMLSKLGSMLKSNPEYNVRVFGHADGVGDPSYNLKLGDRRCDAVLGSLTAAGAMANAVNKASMGESETIGGQAMEATTSRALSRSVEIKVIRIGGEDTTAEKEGKEARKEARKAEKDAAEAAEKEAKKAEKEAKKAAEGDDDEKDKKKDE